MWSLRVFALFADYLSSQPCSNRMIPLYFSACKRRVGEPCPCDFRGTETRMDYIRAIEAQQLRDDLPKMRVGDTVKVHYRIKEGNRERIQAFEGVVIRLSGPGARETFTVRKISYGVGVERTFPVHSPKIAKLEILRHGHVRRAKLYYLRDKVGKAARLREVR